MCSGVLVFWCSGVLVFWCSGVLVFWCSGVLVFWLDSYKFTMKLFIESLLRAFLFV
jgi:hypothetical protein